MDLADLVYDSDIEITVHDNLTINTDVDEWTYTLRTKAEVGDATITANCGGITGGEQENDNASIEDCFNKGDINANGGNVSTSVGGILGVVFTQANNIEINYAYNIGTIELDNTSNQRIGSIIGNRNVNITIALSNCYYLTGTYDVSVGYGDDTGITEWDSIEDFPSVLSVVNGEGAFKEDTNNINNGYPILEWQ